MIVILTNIPTPYRTVFFDEVARQCATRGVGFKVLYCAETEPNRHWPFEPEKMNHPFEVLPGWHFNAMGAYFHLNPSIVSRLRALKPSVVLCGGSWNMPTTQIAATKAIGGGYRTVLGSEGHADAALNKTGLIARVRSIAVRRFDGFAVPNERSADWIRSQVGASAKFVRLKNTVSEQFFSRRTVSERSEARVELQLNESTRLIVHVAQLVSGKGVLELARSFQSIPAILRDNAVLAFVGAGPLEPELRDLAKKQVDKGKIIVVGQQTIDGVRKWLMAANWFALNTYRDANPLSPIEASFAELPILLTTQAGNYSELVSEGVTGYCIRDPRDPSEALIKALEASDAQVGEMGRSAAKNVQQHFNMKQVAKVFIEDMLAI